MLGLSFIYHGIIAIVALKVENYSNDDKKLGIIKCQK